MCQLLKCLNKMSATWDAIDDDEVDEWITRLEELKN